jgi:hypothetical protein
VVVKGRTLVTIVLATVVVALAPVPPAAAAPTPRDPAHPLVLAHFYIWFDASSWNRAKRDYPSLGRYSSDEASIMRKQIQSAKAAGIDGFIVSWKSTETLDRRLAQLVSIARDEEFKLAITYQGLDFNRVPLPAPRVAADLDRFIDEYGTDPVFDIFGKPLVAWSGTWAYSEDDIASVTSTRRDRLLLLASAKNTDDYERVASFVDGEMYYWSSVNPETHKRYRERLQDVSAAVRAHGGLWIAPVAPGFDARDVGGTSVVDRRDGATLREEWNAAKETAPDAIGIISWNEFSENTYIEPSVEFGDQYLRIVADLSGAPVPSGDLASDSPSQTPGTGWNLAILVGFVAFLIGCGVVIARRSRRARAKSSVGYA